MYQNQKFLIALVILFVIGISTATAQNLKLGLESGYGVSSRYSDFTGSRNALWVGANFYVPLNDQATFVINASTMRNGNSWKYPPWNSEEKIELDYINLSGCLQTYFFKKRRLGIGFGMFVAQNYRAKEYWFTMEPKSLNRTLEYKGNYNKTKFGGLLELSYIIYKKNSFSINSNLRYYRDLKNNKEDTPPQFLNPTFNSFVLSIGVIHELSKRNSN